jgi:hypothetical protein
MGGYASGGSARVNARQRTALRLHCRLAGETIHPRFGWGSPLLTHVLTVNSGYE